MPTCFVAPVAVVALWCAVLLPATAHGQESRSAASAKQLVQLLQEKKFDSIAAPHPAAPDLFAAALYFPGQLLVVWARYSAPALLTEKIAKGEYRDVYVDLNSASIPESRVLITDLGADGLNARRAEGQSFDSWDAAGKSIRFDGNWYDQKMSAEDYTKVYVEADRAYAEALDALIAQVKKAS
jgi:hypothetical protein